MVIAVFAMKGGVGVSTVAAMLGVSEAEDRGALLVDLCGDLPATIGLGPTKPQGVTDWVEAIDTAPDDAMERIEIAASHALGILLRGRRVPAASLADLLIARLEREERAVIVDCGCLRPAGALDSPVEVLGDLAFRTACAQAATTRLLVTRACYLSLRAGAKSPVEPTSVALLSEPHRSLGVDDAMAVLDTPVDFDIGVDPVIARLVDSGMLTLKLPRSVKKSIAHGLSRAT